MLITILGPSCSGKDTLAKELMKNYDWKGIVSYTTRDKRPGEKDGIDYHFVDKDKFRNMIMREEFAEYESYSEGRFYGTSKEDISNAAKSDNIYIAVVTPGGLRSIKTIVPPEYLYSIYLTANLGTRVKRYVDRCGIENFDFSDMNEVNGRVNRDYGMFLNIEREVDACYENNNDFKHFPLAGIKQSIMERFDKEIEEIER